MTAGASGDGVVGPVPVVLTLSEERLLANVVRERRERVLVRREVVTEQVQVPVTVRREVLVVEREDLDGPGAGTDPLGAAAALTVVLREERPVVTLRVVPVERVLVEVVAVTTMQQVGDQVRREVLDADGLAPADRPGPDATTTTSETSPS